MTLLRCTQEVGSLICTPRRKSDRYDGDSTGGKA